MPQAEILGITHPFAPVISHSATLPAVFRISQDKANMPSLFHATAIIILFKMDTVECLTYGPSCTFLG